MAKRLSFFRAALLAALAAGLAAAPARADLFAANKVIDGPSADLVSLGNISLSRDGSGGMIYLKRVNGVPRAFASILTDGVWSAPAQLDAGLGQASSSPAIAAANGGRLAAVFVNGGELVATVHDAGQAGFGPPQPLAGGASFPAIGMSINGTAYASFTAPDGAAQNVYVARLDRLSTSFTLFRQPLDVTPGLNGGNTPAKRSRVAVATDGTALVAWAEDGTDGRTHVVTRRASDEGVSNVPQDLTLASLDGQPGGSADSPAPALEDVSDFGWVAFRQTFSSAGGPVSRVVTRRQLGSHYDPPTKIDPLAFPTADGADAPSVAINGSGNGVATEELTSSRQVWADPVQDPDFGTPERLDGVDNNVLQPMPTLALAYDDSGLVAWQQSTGPADPPAVHARAYNGSGFTGEAVVSVPAFGPADVPDGLSASTDRHGNAFIAFMQGDPSSRRLVVGGLTELPTDFDIRSGTGSTNRSRPRISWTPSGGAFGLAGYRVDLDGKPLGITSATSFVPAAPIPDGVHHITVVAIDRYGQANPTPSHVLRIDTVAPRASLSIQGTRAAGSTLNFVVHAIDLGRAASGVGSVTVSFGDGQSASGRHVSHAYARAGSFGVRVVVSDRAGNRRVLRQRVSIR